MNLKINKSYFIDGKERFFIPYKGWNLLYTDGTTEKDELTSHNEGPLKKIPDPLGHGNWHTLDNLIAPDGNKVLEKGVRFITYQSEGYYLAIDDNEDELVNNRSAKATFIQKTNIISKEGKLLSNVWFDDVELLQNGYFLVRKNGSFNLMNCNGELLLKKYERNLRNFIGDTAYSFHDGKLFSNNENGQKVVKQLKNIDKENEYIIYGPSITCDGIVTGAEILKGLESVPKGIEGVWIIQRVFDDSRNLMDKNGYILFDKWYEEFCMTTISGLYLVKDLSRWNLVDLRGKILNQENIGQPITGFKNNLLLVKKGKTYAIVNTKGDVVLHDFTSAMWTDRGVWIIHVASFDKEYYGLHGDGNDITCYAHEILISNRGDFILEKHNVWYLVKPNGELKPVIKAKPRKVIKNLKLTSNNLLKSEPSSNIFRNIWLRLFSKDRLRNVTKLSEK